MSSSEPIREIGDIIPNIGRWQILNLVLFLYLGLPCAFTTFTTVFIAPNVEYTCEGNNASIPDQCTLYNSTEKCEKWIYDTSLYGNTIVKEWDLVCDNAWLVSLSQSIYFIGYMMAVLVLGQLSDRFGRRPLIMISLFLAIIFSCVLALSSSFIMFLVIRFLQAFFRSGWFLISFVYMMEVGDKRARNLAALISQFGWNIGLVLSPLFVWNLHEWRHITWLAAGSFIFMIPVYWTMPESPQWLVSQGRIDEAETIVTKILKINHQDSSHVPEKLKSLAEYCLVNASTKEKKKNMIDIFKTPNLRFYTIVLYFNWMVATFSFYGLSLNVGILGGNQFINFLITAAMEVPASIIGYYFVQTRGRKIPMVVSLLLGGVLCCLFIPFVESELWIRITLVCLGKLCLGISFYILYLYSAEIYPTVVRNVGMGACSMIGRIGSILAPFMKELANATNKGVPLGLIGALSILSGLLFIFLPETFNRPLPNTLIQQKNSFKELSTPSKQ